MNRINVISKGIVDYYSKYQKGYIGDVYDNIDEAISDIKDLLNTSPEGQMEEILDEINYLFKNEDLGRPKNMEQLHYACTIAFCLNKIVYEKAIELGE